MSTKTSLGWSEQLSETQFAYLLLAPAFTIALVIAIWPILWTAEMSLHSNTMGASLVGEFVGLDNYVSILTGNAFLPNPFFDFQQPFQSSLLVTLIFTIGSVSAALVIGFGQALVLNKSFRGRSIVRLAFLIPWAVPVAIQGMMFFLLFSPGFGIGTGWLKALGLQHADAPLAYSTEATIITMIAEVWKQSAFVAIIVLAGLQSIDRNLYRVAQVAGASKWQQFKSVTFPLVLPTVLIALIFRTVGGMRVYGAVKIIAGCDVVPVLTCATLQEFNNHRYGTASTIAIILAVVVSVMVSVYLVKFTNREGEN